MALCGVLAYSGLFPGHIVSQLVTDLAEHGFSHRSQWPGVTTRSGTANPQPTNGAKKHCPFCTGYASFQLASFGSHTILLPPRNVGGDVLAIEDDMVLRKSAITPQSRGPPLLSA